MAYIITEPCVGACETDCVEVCPVDCIHGPDSVTQTPHKGDLDKAAVVGKQLYIDPDTCIDCGVCEPECPVDAIFEEALVPDKWKSYTQKNADFFKS